MASGKLRPDNLPRLEEGDFQVEPLTEADVSYIEGDMLARVAAFDERPRTCVECALVKGELKRLEAATAQAGAPATSPQRRHYGARNAFRAR